MEDDEEINDDMLENEADDRDAFNDDTFGDAAGVSDDLTFGSGADGSLLGAGPVGVFELEASERAAQFLRERAALEQERLSAGHAAHAPPPATSYLRVSGVPRLGEEQIRLLLSYFGELASFSLGPDPSGAQTDVAYISYVDASAEAAAIDRLHGMVLAGGKLFVSTAARDELAAPPPVQGGGLLPDEALDVSALEASMRALPARPQAPPALPAEALDVSSLEAALRAAKAVPSAAAAPPAAPPAALPLYAQQPHGAQQATATSPHQLLQQRLIQQQKELAHKALLLHAQQQAQQQPPLPPTSFAAAADAGRAPAAGPAAAAAPVAQLAEAERSIAAVLRQLALETQQREAEASALRSRLAALPAMRAQPGADARALAEAEANLVGALNASAAQALALQQRAAAAQADLAAVQQLLRAQLAAAGGGPLPPAISPPLPPRPLATPRAPAGPAGGAGAKSLSPYGPGGAPVWASLLPGMPRLPPSARVGVRMTLAELEMIVR